jgi:hypothetical protein
MAKNKTTEDFANDGFNVYNQEPKVDKVVTPKFTKNESKVIIMDNREVINAVKESNQALQDGLKQLIYNINSKPEGFTLNIERDQRGFMKSIKVKINK